MTRIAIVAASEQLRAALATTLRTNPAFDVVAVAASEEGAVASADVVLIARDNNEASGKRVPLMETARGGVLTNREQQILELLADGLGNKQIAARLGISPNTVKTHLELLFDKLSVSTRAEAVATGMRRGLLLL